MGEENHNLYGVFYLHQLQSVPNLVTLAQLVVHPPIRAVDSGFESRYHVTFFKKRENIPVLSGRLVIISNLKHCTECVKHWRMPIFRQLYILRHFSKNITVHRQAILLLVVETGTRKLRIVVESRTKFTFDVKRVLDSTPILLLYSAYSAYS